MTRIDINEIKRLTDRLDEINRLPLTEIEWMDGDKPLEIAAGAIDEWRFVGLSNEAFIRLEGFRGWEPA